VRFHILLVAVFALAFNSAPTLGCSCVQPPPGTETARDLAQWRADRSDAIFEARVASVELKWALIEAKVGAVIPADIEDDNSPAMHISFDVSRSYRGEQQKNTRIWTGVGGGDCGFDFQAGEKYLVYAFADESGRLSTGICSGTALLDERKADVSYLRGEPIVSENTARTKNIATGKLCGRVVRAGLDSADSQLFLLRLGSKSPVPSDEAELGRDGSFCAANVIPGRYYLVFTNRSEESPTSFVFFPGVTKSSEAEAIQVTSGQANSQLVFNVPTQPTFSVSGNVLVSNKSALPAESKVILLSADPLSFLQTYSQDIAPIGSFEFPQVLPGKYWSFVVVNSDGASKWLTRKLEVDVDVRTTNLSLELIAK
jgi:hypothetical protein